MEEMREGIILGCVAIYMIACIAIGLWAMRRTKTTRDFFMAGRSLGVMVREMLAWLGLENVVPESWLVRLDD